MNQATHKGVAIFRITSDSRENLSIAYDTSTSYATDDDATVYSVARFLYAHPT